MTEPLLKTLLADPSAAQVAGGVMMIVLFSSVGAIAAFGMASVARRVFLGRFEQFFWAGLLLAIAVFYMGFAAWFEAPARAWNSEIAAIALVAFLALVGSYWGPALAVGYAFHGLWDIGHSVFGTDMLGHALSDIPLGYGMFCLGFDFAAVAYLLWWPKSWDDVARFQPLYWRESA